MKESREGDDGYRPREIPISVAEPHVSNMGQGVLHLVLLTGPFLHVLSLVSRGVVAGLLYVDPLRLA